MALPRNVKLRITYDGAVTKTATKTAAKSTSATGDASASSTYTVVSGDTLWAIAKKYYGSGAQYTKIYKANKDLIESTAKAHGKKSSDNGHWIWPGETLTIPGADSTSTAQASSKKRKTGKSNSALGDLISGTATAFTYTDVASGQSDSASITMYDITKDWMSSRKPKKGAKLGAKLEINNWDKQNKTEIFNCGNFILDDISFSGRPVSCVLGVVSVPANDSFKTLTKTKTWEKTTIRDIGKEIANNAGVSLVYDASAVSIDEIEQSSQTDSAFLCSLCEKYGLGMKVYNHKIVIFDIVAYEKKKAVKTIKETDCVSWDINETIDGTYTGVSLSYTNPDLDDPIKVTMGSKGRMYELNVQANSQYDAELQAAAKVNEANRNIQTATLTLMGKKACVATQCVRISGFGNYDDKYYIDSVKHTVGSSGYRTQYTMHKVQQAIKVN